MDADEYSCGDDENENAVDDDVQDVYECEGDGERYGDAGRWFLIRVS